MNTANTTTNQTLRHEDIFPVVSKLIDIWDRYHGHPEDAPSLEQDLNAYTDAFCIYTSRNLTFLQNYSTNIHWSWDIQWEDQDLELTVTRSNISALDTRYTINTDTVTRHMFDKMGIIQDNPQKNPDILNQAIVSFWPSRDSKKYRRPAQLTPENISENSMKITQQDS